MTRRGDGFSRGGFAVISRPTAARVHEIQDPRLAGERASDGIICDSNRLSIIIAGCATIAAPNDFMSSFGRRSFLAGMGSAAASAAVLPWPQAIGYAQISQGPARVFLRRHRVPLRLHRRTQVDVLIVGRPRAHAHSMARWGWPSARGILCRDGLDETMTR